MPLHILHSVSPHPIWYSWLRLFHRRSIWRYDKLSSSTSSARQFDFALGIQIRFSLKLVSWLREPASHLFAWDYYCSVIAMNRTDGANIGCLIIFSHLWANAWSMQTPKTLLNWILRSSTKCFLTAQGKSWHGPCPFPSGWNIAWAWRLYKATVCLMTRIHTGQVQAISSRLDYCACKIMTLWVPIDARLYTTSNQKRVVTVRQAH